MWQHSEAMPFHTGHSFPSGPGADDLHAISTRDGIDGAIACGHHGIEDSYYSAPQSNPRT